VPAIPVYALSIPVKRSQKTVITIAARLVQTVTLKGLAVAIPAAPATVEALHNRNTVTASSGQQGNCIALTTDFSPLIRVGLGDGYRARALFRRGGAMPHNLSPAMSAQWCLAGAIPILSLWIVSQN
jgi:hypothetical protein